MQTSSGGHPSSCLVSARGYFPGGKWSGREPDHSLPSGAEDKNACIYSHSSIFRHGMHGDNFTPYLPNVSGSAKVIAEWLAVLHISLVMCSISVESPGIITGFPEAVMPMMG
jgi:hypothetical protein